MTTLTSPEGQVETINARRTESLDAPSILSLVQPSTKQLFGRVDVVNLIEKAVLAVTLSNEQEEVLGHAAFYDYPNMPGVDQSDWEEWMNQSYDCRSCTPLNTLFMHYFVAKPEYSHGCAKEIIRTMYNAVPELHFCFLIVPTGVYPESSIAEVFSPMDKIEGATNGDNCALFLCQRFDHVPVLHIRQARVEDHDDLTPIFNRQSDMLTKTYGDYFLAELVEAQDENMHCIVAEVDGSAVGFMSIYNKVNVELLNECFELGPLHGLRTPHRKDITDPNQKPPTPTPPIVAPPQGGRPTSGQSDSSSSDSYDYSRDVMIRLQSKGTEATLRYFSSLTQSSGTEAEGSAKSDVKVKPKLSDAHLGSSTTSLLSASTAEGATNESPPGSRLPSARSSIKQASRGSKATPGEKSNEEGRFIPTYHGPSSAFSIQLFCIDERYEMRSQDFLVKAFELFPTLDYCVITVPHLVPEFPLLQGFLRVTPRCPSILPQELYVFARGGLLKDFIVRPVCTSDMDSVEHVVNSLDLHENLLADVEQYNKARRDDDGTQIQAYVAECCGQIVGVSVIRQEEDIEFIRSHYNIEDFIYYNHHRREEHGHLHHYALNPIFAHYSKHFLREILRLSKRTCLYYPLFPPYVSEEQVEHHSLVSALNDMVPVRARRQITYEHGILGENAPSERVLKQPQPNALNHINRKLTLEPKVTINARIVVVGASDVGIAFLEALVFCPHLRFNNLTLVSPNGLLGETMPDDLRDQMLSSSLCYNQQNYCNMALRTWVNTVYGKMTAIDRQKKHVIVNGKTMVPFDHLILCTGMQYQIAAPTGADVSKLLTSAEAPNSPDRRFTGTPPRNVFTVNDPQQASEAIEWMRENLLATQGKAVVYGFTLDAYCCVQTLLALGIEGKNIHLVEPPLNYQTTCFNNCDVENAVLAALQETGVQVHSGYLLAEWNDPETVSSVSFTSCTKPLELDCAVFFSYYKRCVDYDAFKAINDACLVYDGKLVVDAAFHTNDVSIRGAGTLTKFQRCYHADQWTHANFNSKEVGTQLAGELLGLFDPTLEPEPEVPKDLLKLIPMYRNAKVQGAYLPGGFHYLHIAKPGLHMPLDTQVAQGDYGREFITGSPDGSPGYFRLHVNQYHSIETITCLSKEAFPVNNIMCLYGLHERYLNNMVSRFDEGLIKDFYSFFKESWCMAVFHDRFTDFRDEVRELLITKPAEDAEALEDKIRQLIDEDLTLNKTQRNQLSKDFAESGVKRAVETRLLSFISYNYYHLPMFAKPGMV